jgi:enoyl-CoA hydratase/carnithine racemase
MEYLKITIHNEHSVKKIVNISLNSPHNLNAIHLELYEELTGYLDAISADKEVGALIFSSELATSFSAGVDVKFVQNLTNQEASEFFSKISSLLEKVVHLPIPTISVLSGYTFGAGADLAISCDFRIASKSTAFRFPGPQFGLILGTQRLIHEIGPSRARFLTLSGSRIDGQRACEYGLVHEVYENEVMAKENALKLAETVLTVPVHAVQLLKKICNEQPKEATDLTRESVLEGDFNSRFNAYITQTVKKKS